MSNRLYIGKLGALSKNDVQREVSRFGTVSDFMMKDNYAFVEYSSEAEAKTAQVELDGKFINGQRIMAEFAKPKSADETYFQTHPRIYIGRLNNSIKRPELLTLFSKFGDIVDVLIKEDFAFLEYAESKSASQAIQEMNGYTLNGVKLSVEEARPKDESKLPISTPRLYIGKIPATVKKHDIVQVFSVFGDIVQLNMKEEYAFIEYANIQDAYKAYQEMNGNKLGGSRIIVQEAKPKYGDFGFRGRESQASVMPIPRYRRSPRRSLSRSRSRSRE